VSGTSPFCGHHKTQRGGENGATDKPPGAKGGKVAAFNAPDENDWALWLEKSTAR